MCIAGTNSSSFGAVLEEFEVKDALMAALAETKNGAGLAQ
jgi:hypothetical protein